MSGRGLAKPSFTESRSVNISVAWKFQSPRRQTRGTRPSRVTAAMSSHAVCSRGELLSPGWPALLDERGATDEVMEEPLSGLEASQQLAAMSLPREPCGRPDSESNVRGSFAPELTRPRRQAGALAHDPCLLPGGRGHRLGIK